MKNESGIHHLPQELIIEILSLVPAKTVGKCRCVSKPWKSLLSEPQFIKAHCTKTHQKTHLIFEQESLLLMPFDCRSLYSTTLMNAHQLFDEITLVAKKLNFGEYGSLGAIYGTSCCNGLVLVGDVRHKFSLINPLTKEVKILPSLPCDVDYGCFPSFGVGYDAVSDDYKVVVMCCYKHDDDDDDDDAVCSEGVVCVYSVRNGTWKMDGSCYCCCRATRRRAGVYVDGSIHWIEKTSAWNVLAFDLHLEKFRPVMKPVGVGVKDVDVGMWGGCLSVKNLLGKVAVVCWKMEEYGVKDSWTKFSIIHPDKVPMILACFVAEEQVVLEKCRANGAYNPKLVIYNVKDKTFKNIVVRSVVNYFYVEGTFRWSLVSPHCDNEVAR